MYTVISETGSSSLEQIFILRGRGLLLERMEVGQNFKTFTLQYPGWQGQDSQVSSVIEEPGAYIGGGQRGGGKTWNRANIR